MQHGGGGAEGQPYRVVVEERGDHQRAGGDRLGDGRRTDGAPGDEGAGFGGGAVPHGGRVAGVEERGGDRGALALHRQGLAVARAGGDPLALAREGLAGAYALAGRPVQAASLLGTAARAREAADAPLPEAECGDIERITARALAALGARTFAAEYSTDADDDDPDLGDHGGPTAGEG